MSQALETVLEIDLKALEHNFRYFSEKAGAGVKRMAVVKANGYGSEVVAVSQRLAELGADYLAVAFPQEGIFLREAGIKLPILVFQSQAIHFERLIDNCLEPSLYSEKQFLEFVKIAELLGLKEYPVHLKFNTGLNRLGFSEEETEKVYNLLSSTEAVKAVSFFSHLSASGDWREREFTLEQIYTFRRIAIDLYGKMNYEPWLHICNTSGILNYPEAVFHMVRLGIGLYGYGNDPQIDEQLKPVATLKTVISQLHELKKGDSVGYDRAFKADRAMTSATLPLGYGDGFARSFGNERTGVYIGEHYAPVIGNVCMDMIMIDVTGVPCEEGDEVVIFGGPQRASTLAKAGASISYELLSSISSRVKRVLI